jgi:hypothetical protein
VSSNKIINSILLLYAHPYAVNAPTIMEHVGSFEKYSRYKVWAVNTEFGFPGQLTVLKFKVVVLHYSLFGTYPFRLYPRFVEYLQTAHFNYRIAFFQDEYQYCPQRFALIDTLSIDCIYTLLEPPWVEKVYYKNTRVKSVLHTLTGYVDDSLLEKSKSLTKPFPDRRTDVGYRARPLPYFMGRGAREKTDIADKWLSLAGNAGLQLDIKTAEEDRIYGEAWHAFVSDCKAMLGVEAGVSIFDLADDIRPAVDQMLSENPAVSFDAVFKALLQEWEDNIYYRTISPRVFECAAFKVLQILFEGQYSGVLTPGVHYLPLKKDFSNMAEVLTAIADEKTVRRITQRAYDDLIVNPRYSYRRFVSAVDDHIETATDLAPLEQQAAKTLDNLFRRENRKRLRVARFKHYFFLYLPFKSNIKALYRQLAPRGRPVTK